MRVSIVDPSLFTLPYDRGLAGGLTRVGHQVTLHGRPLGADDPDAASTDVSPDFYRVANSRFAAALPRSPRLLIKGLDHAWSMRRLVRRLARDKPDIIHMQWLPLPLIDNTMLQRLRRIAPLVLTVHDTNPFNGDPSSTWQRHAIANCLARFGRLIVHTAQGLARLREQGIQPGRLVQLPHGPLSEPPADLAPDPMSGPLTLLLFGKIKPYKGADVLIEAFGRLPDAVRAQARIRIVGKAYMDLAPLRALAERHGIADRVEIDARFVSDADIPALLGPNVVAVFPYREIEASGVLFLALAHGRPIIASNLGAFPETILDGREGLLVPPDDVAVLTSALEYMIADRHFAASCARAARAAAAAVPDWADIARRTTVVYNELKLAG